MRIAFSAAAFILLWALSVFAQNPTFRSQSNVVLVPALVRDASGDAVHGLTGKDFDLEDDGVNQKVQLTEPAESEPLSLVIAIQTGRRVSYEFARMRRLNSLLDPLISHEGTLSALVAFDSAFDLKQAFTGDPTKVHDALAHLGSGDNGAVILDAVAYSIKLLSNAPENSQRVLLLISETRDHGSRIATMDDIAESLGNRNIAVYSLAFSPSTSNILDTMRGTNKDEMGATADILAPIIMARQALRKNTPKALAELTGGEYLVFHSEAAFEDLMLDFQNHLRSRYLLSFQPVDPHPGLHRITVKLKSGREATIQARTTYWAENSIAAKK